LRSTNQRGFQNPDILIGYNEWRIYQVFLWVLGHFCGCLSALIIIIIIANKSYGVEELMEGYAPWQLKVVMEMQ